MPTADSPSDAATDPAAMREQYRSEAFTEDTLATDPMHQFAHWFRQIAAGGMVYEPNAMVVSTATPDGRPSSRTVLLKKYDARGFVFFTNYNSRKGRELDANPYVSLLFPWHPLARQVVVTGTAARIAREETVAYFRTRPHGSQLGRLGERTVGRDRLPPGAHRPVRGTGGPLPRGRTHPGTPQWGGFRVVPETIEFWQGHENRLHDRLRYVREGDDWRVERLCP